MVVAHIQTGLRIRKLVAQWGAFVSWITLLVLKETFKVNPEWAAELIETTIRSQWYEVQEAQGFRGQSCVRTSHSQRAWLQLPPAKKQFGKDIAKIRLMEFSYKQLLRESLLKEPLSTLDLGLFQLSVLQIKAGFWQHKVYK